MLPICTKRFLIIAFILSGISCSRICHPQAALLLEEPYGFWGALNPTGHNAIYFERICAETPVKLRRCEPGEVGAVIARYQGIAGYDWVAIPLVPYLYSVENTTDVPDHVDREMVRRLRNRYREAHLTSLGPEVEDGSFLRGGWKQLVGAAYERRIFAFRFQTSAAQDDALIASMNAGPNETDFNLLFQNCADFARVVLNSYFSGSFHRSIFPDAGVTTPKQITYKLVRYARKHPETGLTVFEIPQIRGYRRRSRSSKNIDESVITTAYAIPIAVINPYVAGALFLDYIIRGRYDLFPKHPQVLGPHSLSALTAAGTPDENAASAAVQVHGAVPGGAADSDAFGGANPGLRETKAANE